MSLNQQIESWIGQRRSLFRLDSRPFITLAYAQSWDGSITTRQGEPLALSGVESSRLTHQLRSLHDGILVGIGTVLSDDPRLTVRDWDGPNPQPIVLDSQLRMPRSARLCHHPDKQCWIMSLQPEADEADSEWEVLPVCDASADIVPLENALKLLRFRGINSLMVEGGATVITAFLKAGFADAVIITISPRLVGGYKAVGELEPKALAEMPAIQPMHCAPLGDDLILWGDLHFPSQGLNV